MSDADFKALAGRIDGMYLALGALVATLEDAQIIDGTALAAGIRRSAVARSEDKSNNPATWQTLMEIADRIDDARANRCR